MTGLDGSRVADDEALLRDAIIELRAAGIQWAAGFKPKLLEVLNIPAATSSPHTRELVRRSLLAHSDQLNQKHRQAFLEAAGFRRGADSSPGARFQAAADIFGVSRRTAYRMVDEAIDSLVTVLLSPQQRCAVQDVDYVFTTSRCRVDLSGPSPTVVMERTLTSHSIGLDHIEERVGYPRLNGEQLNLRALEGCAVKEKRFIAPGIWSLRLGFPRPLQIGEQHSFAISVIFPDHESLEPVVGFLPHTTSYDAKVELVFGENLPEALHRFETMPPLEPESHVNPTAWTRPVQSKHEFVFSQMRPGICYGVRWRQERPRRDNSLTESGDPGRP